MSILVPIFMPKPQINTYIYSMAEREKVIARREAVLSILNQNKGLTLQEIAVITNQDIRTTQAILNVLKKYGKIKSTYTKQGKLWEAI